LSFWSGAIESFLRDPNLSDVENQALLNLSDVENQALLNLSDVENQALLNLSDVENQALLIVGLRLPSV
jgi:hypothetical protein